MIDQLGREVKLEGLPNRIISTVPSITEYLFDLGLGDHVIARTKFCIHPKEALRKPKIGGTKKLHLQQILTLKPDLIIANKEENVREEIDYLAKSVPTYISDVKTLEQAISMMKDLGVLCGKVEESRAWISQIDETTAFKHEVKKQALYLIWKDPYMSVGGDTYIHDMMQYAGYENILRNKLRYPSLDEKQLKTLKPEVVLLSSEPYPFKERHIRELQDLLPDAEIKLVDGELYSWYGSRILKALKSFQ